MRKPLSSSERKGFLWIALVALCVILAGLIPSLFMRYETTAAEPEIHVIREYAENTASEETSTATSKKTQTRKKAAKSKGEGRKMKCQIRRRNPRNEPAND